MKCAHKKRVSTTKHNGVLHFGAEVEKCEHVYFLLRGGGGGGGGGADRICCLKIESNAFNNSFTQ